MNYITVSEASQRWGVSLRQVQRLVSAGRIPGAQNFGKAWMIPADAEKPAGPRKEKKGLDTYLSSDLNDVIAATTLPMPSHNPDAILDTLTEERLRLQYEAELAYLRGDFQRTMRCYQRTKKDDASRLRICPIAVSAAVSLGDYRAYAEIDSYLKEKASKGDGAAVFAELALATAAVSVIAPNMVPEWLKAGNFRTLQPQARANALYLRAKYLHCVRQPDTMLAVAQTALTLSASERGITTTDIYLRVTCAVAYRALEREDEAKRWLLEAMDLALPHGFITPFAELVTALGGLMEQCLEQAYPEYHDAVLGQWSRTWKNWISFHNQFTKDNITLMLSLREYHLALLVARRIPYVKIANQYHISVGRLKNIMLEVYEKLLISGRDELSKYIF
jgi:excisionase family DNA binding protein